MINISQNVTRVKDTIHSTVLGATILAPVVGVVFLFSALIDVGYLSKNTLADVFTTLAAVALCWTTGGLVRALVAQRQYQQKQKDLKTQQAFERLRKIEVSH